MQVITPYTSVPTDHPIQLMADFAMVNAWPLHHASGSEICVEISGHWSYYILAVSWQEHTQALHIQASFDIFTLDQQMAAMREVISRINSKMWLGHFDLNDEANTVAFRYTLLLRGTGGATLEQMEDLIDITLGECERAYPALFQISTGTVCPQTAVDTVMMETMGSA